MLLDRCCLLKWSIVTVGDSRDISMHRWISYPMKVCAESELAKHSTDGVASVCHVSVGTGRVIECVWERSTFRLERVLEFARPFLQGLQWRRHTLQSFFSLPHGCMHTKHIYYYTCRWYKWSVGGDNYCKHKTDHRTAISTSESWHSISSCFLLNPNA